MVVCTGEWQETSPQRGGRVMLKGLNMTLNSFHREVTDKLVIFSGDLKTLMSFICGI